MLSTIRSRCEGAALAPVSPREAEVWLTHRFPDLPQAQVLAAARACGGLLGQAVEALTAGGDDPADGKARELLELLIRGDELSLAQWCVELEKGDRDSFSRLMERAIALLRDVLTLQVGTGRGEDPLLVQGTRLPRKDLLSYVESLEKLRNAAQFNVGVGHLCGALAAGLSGGSR